MAQFAFEDPASGKSGAGIDLAAIARRRRGHAADVMADLEGANPESLAALPVELPVEAAVACGACRLYGGTAAEVVFPTWLAIVAARRLTELLDHAAVDADRLPEFWDTATSDEAEDLVAGLIHARMDTWAALLQLDEVAEHPADVANLETLEAALEDLEFAVERFDRALDSRQDYLSTLAGTRLLANLRDMLAPEFRDPLPWWLDGRLEARAAEIDCAIDEAFDDGPEPTTPANQAASVLTWDRLRTVVAQTFAAAASVPTESAHIGSPRIRWRAPGGSTVADLVPPVTKLTVPDRVVLDFTETSGQPALSLVGSRCALIGVEVTIERRNVDGEDRAVATFPGADVMRAGETAGERPVALSVAGTPWALTPLR